MTRLSEVGRYCSIGPGLISGAASHPTDWFSTSPFQYSDNKFGFSELLADFEYERRDTQSDPTVDRAAPKIGNDVWIGADVTIMRGVEIGDGAIVGTGAVVTKSIPPYAIAAGVPARVIRWRLPEDIVARMLAIKWWRFDAHELSGLPFSRPNEALEELERRIARGIQERPIEYMELGPLGEPTVFEPQG